MGDLDQGSCRDDPGGTRCRIGQRQGTDRKPKAIGSCEGKLDLEARSSSLYVVHIVSTYRSHQCGPFVAQR
jgi:hypothetical protein